MFLKKLVENIDYELLQGSLDENITGLVIDSRNAGKGTLFVCIDGFNTDGHRFIPQAAANGAAAVLCEKNTEIPPGITALLVKSSRKALCSIAAAFYGNPTSKLKLVGITGTNGKTSTAYFMEQVINEAGGKTGMIGTVEIHALKQKLDFKFATSTTPDTIELNQLFAIMADKGAESVVMEVTSHALALNKVDGCEFDTCIFTNLTQDHLDLHKTMENYCMTKARLFKMCKTGVFNADDEYCKKIIAEADCKIITYAIKNDADYKAININYMPDRVSFDVLHNNEKTAFCLNIPGKFSVYNALGVIAAANSMGMPMETIKMGIKAVKGVPGRIQSIKNNKGFNVIVDYAHTPDGVENIIKSVREFTKGRVITVFGCGGDRDKTKRPIMGEISARLSDYTVVTSDNPRTEEPMSIIEDILVGIKPVTTEFEVYPDRREAIFRAIKIARKDDCVIIAGKGHENYEIFKDKTIHFDDTETAKEALEDLE